MGGAYQIFCGKCGKLVEEGDGTDAPPQISKCDCETVDEKVTRMIKKVDDVLKELERNGTEDFS